MENVVVRLLFLSTRCNVSTELGFISLVFRRRAVDAFVVVFGKGDEVVEDVKDEEDSG
jgi:hypothetical protein